MLLTLRYSQSAVAQRFSESGACCLPYRACSLYASAGARPSSAVGRARLPMQGATATAEGHAAEANGWFDIWGALHPLVIVQLTTAHTPTKQ